MTTGLPLMTNVLTPLAKSVLVPIGMTKAASVIDSALHEKIFESGTATLIISNEETENIMKIVFSLQESRLLIKGISEAIKNEAKE